MPTKVSAIVLAAGLSSRMPGRNKLLKSFDGKTLIEHTVDHLLQSRIHELIVVLGSMAGEIRKILRERRLKCVDNPEFSTGMASSIIKGVEAVTRDAEGILIMPGDMPFVKPEEIDLCLSTFDEAPAESIVAPSHNGVRGHPVIFSVAYKEELLKLTGDMGARSICKKHTSSMIEVPMADDHILKDIDTREDYLAFARND